MLGTAISVVLSEVPRPLPLDRFFWFMLAENAGVVAGLAAFIAGVVWRTNEAANAEPLQPGKPIRRFPYTALALALWVGVIVGSSWVVRTTPVDSATAHWMRTTFVGLVAFMSLFVGCAFVAQRRWRRFDTNDRRIRQLLAQPPPSGSTAWLLAIVPLLAGQPVIGHLDAWPRANIAVVLVAVVVLGWLLRDLHDHHRMRILPRSPL